jgi:hypothetical protein
VSDPRPAILYALDQVRAVLGPNVMDQRSTSVTILTQSWSQGQRGAGLATIITTTSLPSYTKVRHVSLREIAQSGGLFEDDDVIVGPITPQYTFQVGAQLKTGGFTEAQLKPVLTVNDNGTQVIYRLALQSGATGIVGDYTLISFRRDRTYRFMLVLRRERTTP